MGTVFDNLYPASFKGAPFLFQVVSSTSGRKIVNYEFPNKDDRKVDDLGRLLATYTITGIIKGENYEQNVRRLTSALNEAGAGILVHPFRGNVRVTAEPHTLTESLRNIGIAEFSMVFLETPASSFPNASKNNVSQIADQYNKTYQFSGDDFNENYVVTNTKNISVASDKLISLEQNLVSIADTVPSTEDTDTSFRRAAKNFGSNAFKIASPSGDTGNDISGLINLFDTLGASGNPISRFDASKQLVGFGSSDVFFNINSQQIIQRNNNSKFINGTVNWLAFINLCDAAKNISYSNEVELDNRANTIDALYDQIVDSPNNKFSNEALDNIDEMRNQIRIFFEQERLVVNKIVVVNTNPIPATILTYQYYGNTDEYDDILAVNGITNPARISGNIKILEQ